MNATELLTLGLQLSEPWTVAEHSLDLTTCPDRELPMGGTLRIKLDSKRGSLYPCPHCGKLCKAHDYDEHTWRHLDFFQHVCYITAKIPRVSCPEHGIHTIKVPWAREGSGFTLLFEQVVIMLAKAMPVNTIAKQLGVTDHCLWRIIEHYVTKARSKMDMSSVEAVALDETASKRGHKYVTIFLDTDKEKEPVLFATPGKGSDTLKEFKDDLEQHNGQSTKIARLVCDMSPAFLSGCEKHFPFASVTVDWFHVVQAFTTATDEVRKKEARKVSMLRGSRWATLKSGDTMKTPEQVEALADLQQRGLATGMAYEIKEKLRWVKEADTKQAARWRATHFVLLAKGIIEKSKQLLEPMEQAVSMFQRHLSYILSRWDSDLTNARTEGMNGLFQAARNRARGYRNQSTFITMIYLIGAPIRDLLQWT